MSMRNLCLVILCLTAIAIKGQVRDDKPIIDSKKDNLDGGHVVRKMKVSKPVDLGLPSGTKWAEWNVGASAPEQKGFYYAWGETEPKEVYSWKTYFDAVDRQNLKNDNVNGFKEFLSDRRASIVGTSHDVAHVKWGKDWLMPTVEQWKELIKHCKTEPKNQKGVKGLCFTGPNGNSIFIPGWGFMHFRTLNDAGELEYWTGNLADDISAYAVNGNPELGNVGEYNIYRRRGKQVRAVWNSVQAESYRSPGLLTIKTSPTDCEVKLDGTTVGRTPMNASKVPSGKHVMYVLKDGYRLFRKELNIDKGEHLKENLSLQQMVTKYGGIGFVKSGDFLYHLGNISEKEWSSVIGGNGDSWYSASFKDKGELLKFVDYMERETGKKAEIMFQKYGETIKQGDVLELYIGVPELPKLIVEDYQKDLQENIYMDSPYCFKSILEVDSEGIIDCPLLGRCFVVGLNESQCKELLKTKYMELLKQLGYDFENYNFSLIVSMKNRFFDKNAILQFNQDSMSKGYGSHFGIRLKVERN